MMNESSLYVETNQLLQYIILEGTFLSTVALYIVSSKVRRNGKHVQSIISDIIKHNIIINIYIYICIFNIFQKHLEQQAYLTVN